MQTSEDIAMLSALKQDNKLEAYQYFFTKYYKALCVRACQILGDPEFARVTVQELFIEVWKQRKYKDIDQSAGGFFYLLTERRCREIQEARTQSENFKAICPPCQTGPALVPQALRPQFKLS